MCIGQTRLFTRCGHTYGYDIQQPCEAGTDPTGSDCSLDELEITSARLCSKPSLCPDCYRDVEMAIFDFHANLMIDVAIGGEPEYMTRCVRVLTEGLLEEGEIDEGKVDLVDYDDGPLERVERVRDEMEGIEVFWDRRLLAIASLKRALGRGQWTVEKEKMVRAEVLAEFRRSMGVWGDG